MEITLKKLIEKINNVHQTIQEDVIKSVSTGLTLRNWIIGYYIVEYEQNGSDKAKYGDKIINNLVSNLKHIKGMSLSNIKSFRQFYLTYPQLSQSVNGFLNIENIKSQSVTGKSKSIPVQNILEFTGLEKNVKYSENDLESSLLNHIQDFLLELGNGFCFESRQKRISIDNEHDRIDLVFYHRILKCHILIDLKIREFSHADVGQMNFYLNYYKNEISETTDNDPIGLILCANKNHIKVEYATAGLDNNLFVSKYKINLPSIEEITEFIEDELESLRETIK